ncbi:LysR family transcriptional regulator [Variovorax sp. J22P271]|uniref:LysR family transcriptional regulator n=1 Tax=Variovorax davisae TaxID=3053515 RepID=UPI00257509BC|nr:LysR family transcriptional regulator [Variovorax sp. J22P271]MDM0032035.1 LysR family transcriptional regulator [Variovorax sp. J22P271]
MNFSIRQLRAFVATARLRSFTRAGEQLHVTQPGLSAMLRELEGQLDCRLFERTTRNVALTAQGKEFLPTAVRVLKDLEEAAVSLGQITSTQRRRLSVGATPLIASSIVPEACAAFAGMHPSVQVELQDLDRATIYERVQSGELDAGFGAFMTVSSLVRRRRLLESPLVLVCAGNEASKSVRWKELPAAPLLGLPLDNPIQQLVEGRLRSAGSAATVAQRFNQLHTLLAMVESGAGPTILPDFVASAASRYRVTFQKMRTPAVAVDFYEITKAGRSTSDLLADFGICLVQAFESHSEV